MEKCGCGSDMVWVRILSNNHRTQFCRWWVIRELALGEPKWFAVED